MLKLAIRTMIAIPVMPFSPFVIFIDRTYDETLSFREAILREMVRIKIIDNYTSKWIKALAQDA